MRALARFLGVLVGISLGACGLYLFLTSQFDVSALAFGMSASGFALANAVAR